MSVEASADIDLAVVEKIVKENLWRRGPALTILEGIQHHFGWVSPEAVAKVAELTNYSAPYLYGVLSFYDDFRIAPPGAITVVVCNGSACGLNHETEVLREIERVLDIDEVTDQAAPHPLFTLNKYGYVTDDGKVVLRKLDCIGACQLAPVIQVGDQMIGRLTPETTAAELKTALAEAGHDLQHPQHRPTPAENFHAGNLS